MSRDIDSGYHTCLVKLRKKGCTYTVWWYYATLFNPNTINQLILNYKAQKFHDTKITTTSSSTIITIRFSNTIDCSTIVLVAILLCKTGLSLLASVFHVASMIVNNIYQCYPCLIMIIVVR